MIVLAIGGTLFAYALAVGAIVLAYTAAGRPERKA